MSLTQTRRSWHAIAELVLAGPQVRATGHLRLRVVPGGFATAYGPDLRVEHGELVAGGIRVAIDGRTCSDLAAAVGVEVGAPVDHYDDGSGVRADEVLRCDVAAAERLARCFAIGDEALRQLTDGRPPLWPEHFDVGLTIDGVNYGVSPGDGHIDEPYAYVGPWRRRRRGEFWNAAFGAARPLRQLGDAATVLDFFSEGRRRAAADPPAEA